MAPLVVPDVCRFTVNQTFEGQPVANIIDMQIDTTGSSTTRTDAIFNIAGDILNNWTDHVLQFQSNNLTAVDVSWVDLNTLTGSTGARSTTSDNSWPQAGPGAQSAFPGMVALRVDKQVVGNRQARNGRMYLCGMSEDLTADSPANEWAPSTISSYQAEINEFLDGINDQDIGGIPIDIQRQLVVVHTVNGVGTGYSEVSNLLVRSRVASQVRRTRT